MNLDAILRINAKVSGTEGVQALGRGIDGVKKSATGVRGALQGMAGSVGGLGGALQMLVPALSVAGLGAMAQSAINTGDQLNDMRQKTGVSVEVLSQLSKAAQMSGTTIESVGGAMNKLNRGLAQGAKSPAAGALREIGVSATDAAGKLRSTDAVLLDVADRFAKMPDGAQKTALAMRLFGRAGADMVPMLNMGGEAIRALGVTMTGDFAKQADELNDKLAVMQADFSMIGVKIGTSLMPALMGLADVVGGIADAFSKLPEPVQGLIGGIALLAGAFVLLAPLITSAISLIGAIGPVVAGVMGALSGLGGVLAAVGAAIAGFITWPVLLVAGLVAAGVAIFAFRDQIGAFFQQVGQMAVEGWNALIAPLQPVLDAIGQLWAAAAQLFYQIYIEPIVKSSQFLWGLITRGWNAVSGVASGIFRAIANTYQNLVVKPLTTAWSRIVDTGKAALRGLLGWAAGAINGVINMVNAIIRGINRVRSLAGLSTFGQIGNVTVPAFAEGGYVDRPTLGLVGEAGKEYIVPEGKAAGFANNILAGRRGASAIPAGSGSGAMGSGPIQIDLTIASVRQDAQGQQWMTVQEGERLLRNGLAQMQRVARTPGGRYAQGVR